MVKILPTKLEGVLIIESIKFGDDRGFFSETYHAQKFEQSGLPAHFVQDNHSFSKSVGVLRGLHYQLPPHAQGKLVRVVRGRVFDVAVDIRRHSPTFRQWVGVELSAENWRQFYIPPGFAHGFLTLEENCEFLYKVTDFYAPQSERAIRFDDCDLGIDWPLPHQEIQLSPKDAQASCLKDADIFEE